MPREYTANILVVLLALTAGVSIMEGWTFCIKQLEATQSPAYLGLALMTYFGGAIGTAAVLKRLGRWGRLNAS